MGAFPCIHSLSCFWYTHNPDHLTLGLMSVYWHFLLIFMAKDFWYVIFSHSMPCLISLYGFIIGLCSILLFSDLMSHIVRFMDFFCFLSETFVFTFRLCFMVCRIVSEQHVSLISYIHVTLLFNITLFFYVWKKIGYIKKEYY